MEEDSILDLVVYFLYLLRNSKPIVTFETKAKRNWMFHEEGNDVHQTLR